MQSRTHLCHEGTESLSCHCCPQHKKGPSAGPLSTCWTPVGAGAWGYSTPGPILALPFIECHRLSPFPASFHSQSDQVPYSTSPAVSQPLFPVLFISEGAEGVPRDSGHAKNVKLGEVQCHHWGWPPDLCHQSHPLSPGISASFQPTSLSSYLT